MTTLRSDQPHRYFFVHIMRTAGTALRERLLNHFGRTAVYPTKGLDGPDPVRLYVPSVDLIRERLEARGDQIRVITGHLPLRTVELIEGRYTAFTLLREPVERMLSYLRQRRGKHGSHESQPLEEAYDGLYGLADNNMTKMLSLTPAEMTDSLFTGVEVDHDHVERAKEALAGMAAVGLQEQFDDFCDRLAARFGWRLGEPETVNPTAPVDVPESLRDRIAEDNALDVELYEFAKELVAADHTHLETVGMEQ
jgi:hypothetical protein